MKRRFIVLIDFSDHSELLLTFSHKWALHADAELLLVHQVVRPIPSLGDAETLSKIKSSTIEQTLLRLKSFAERIVGPDTSIKYHTDLYNVSSAIVKLQAPDTVDYLFVGMNDKTGLENLIMTSTALQLTDHVNSIVIALPTTLKDLRFESLYVGIKPSYPLDESRFEELLSITSGMIGQINFFSMLKQDIDPDKSAAYLQGICTKYEGEIPVSYEIFETNNTTAAIKEYMQQNKGVLVVQKGPRNFIDIFRKFFTTEIVHHAQIPVVILP